MKVNQILALIFVFSLCFNFEFEGNENKGIGKKRKRNDPNPQTEKKTPATQPKGRNQEGPLEDEEDEIIEPTSKTIAKREKRKKINKNNIGN